MYSKHIYFIFSHLLHLPKIHFIFHGVYLIKLVCKRRQENRHCNNKSDLNYLFISSKIFNYHPHILISIFSLFLSVLFIFRSNYLSFISLHFNGQNIHSNAFSNF